MTEQVYGKPYKRKRKKAEIKLYKVRNYQAGMQNRLTNDWLTTGQSADELLRWQLNTLRARSRDLFRNNDYAKSFGRKLKINVIGAGGIQLQSKVKRPDGLKLDKSANAMIEAAFLKYSKPQDFTTAGDMSRRDFDANLIESLARDGEVLIRKVRGYDNQFGFALQMLEPDLIDIEHHEDMIGKNRVSCGVEFNGWGKPVAYYLKTDQGNRKVNAADYIHCYLKERPGQSRGVPWMHTAILRLRSLGAYEEAAVIAARVGASGMGIVLKPNTEDQKYTGETEGGDPDSGSYMDNVEPGAMWEAPPGADFKTYDPAYPAANHAEFMKAVLRGAASGMGISYNSLSSDLEGVNFSSIRQGVMEDRDWYKYLTGFITDHVHNNYYKDWLKMAITTRQVNLPINDIDRFSEPKWQGRGFEWIDPLKDTKSNIEQLDNYLTSPQRVLSDRGLDADDVLDEIQTFNEMLAARKLPPRGGINEKTIIQEDDK